MTIILSDFILFFQGPKGLRGSKGEKVTSSKETNQGDFGETDISLHLQYLGLKTGGI